MADTNNNVVLDPAAGAVGALSIAMELVALLNQKGLISLPEGLEVYKKALARMHQVEQRENVRRVIQAVVPGAEI